MTRADLEAVQAGMETVMATVQPRIDGLNASLRAGIPDDGTGDAPREVSNAVLALQSTFESARTIVVQTQRLLAAGFPTLPTVPQGGKGSHALVLLLTQIQASVPPADTAPPATGLDPSLTDIAKKGVLQ